VVLVAFIYYNFVYQFSPSSSSSSDDDLKKLIELLNRDQYPKRKENVYTNKITQNTVVKYASNKDIELIIRDDTLIGVMKDFLEQNNNSYIITLPEINPSTPYSFIVASMWKINRTECDENGLLFWRNKCQHYDIRYPYEFIFNPCIVGGSEKSEVLIDYIPNPYNPFDKRQILRRRSIKLLYTRVSYFKGKVYFDEIVDWWEDEIGIELQNKISMFSTNKKRLCFY